MKNHHITSRITLILATSLLIALFIAIPAQAEMVMLSPTADSYVDSENPTSVYGKDVFLISRFNSQTDRKTQAFLRFDLSLIPAGSSVSEATLKLYLKDMSGEKAVLVEAFRATGDWDEQTLSWNTKPTGPGLGKTASISDNKGNKNVDLTSFVAGWLAGSYPNFGVFLDYGGNTTHSVVLNSREAPKNQPYLVVYYTPPSSGTGAPAVGLNMAEGKPPAIMAVNITKLSKDSVTVNWMTDVKADSTVKFGKTAAYDYVVRADKGKDKTAHSVILRGLSPGTGYHYRVFSKSAANMESSSADLKFKTTGQPVADSVLPSTPYGWLKLIVIVLAAGSTFLISIVAAVELKHWLDSRPRA